MASATREISRRITPEERELSRKREELALLQATLAERELELVELRRQLSAFEGQYLRDVGGLYAELDEWNARIADLSARLHPSPEADAAAEAARDEARKTHDTAHGIASQSRDFQPSPELKSLFREAARRIHPDFAIDPADVPRRTRFMAEANQAYERGDAEALERILDEFNDGSENNIGEGIGAELVRIIRQISRVTDRIEEIKREMATLLQSEIAQLKDEAEEAKQRGRDLLAELAASVRERIASAQLQFETLERTATHL